MLDGDNLVDEDYGKEENFIQTGRDLRKHLQRAYDTLRYGLKSL